MHMFLRPVRTATRRGLRPAARPTDFGRESRLYFCARLSNSRVELKQRGQASIKALFWGFLKWAADVITKKGEQAGWRHREVRDFLDTVHT